MKIFLDTANIPNIKKWVATGIIDGVTTNPSLISKEGGDAKKQLLEICSLLPDGDVSIEVTETEVEHVYRQAKEIAALGNNVTVKIPCHILYYPVISRLVKEGVRINVTLVFTAAQGMMMAKLGVRYISPFVGRWDDIDVDGVQILQEMRTMLDIYGFETELLAASIRHVRHFHEAIMIGADVATLPIDVLEKAVSHPLTDAGMVKFNEDWAKLEIMKFP